MQNKVFDFKTFLNEVSLEGNLGLPGERENDPNPNWLKKTAAKKDREMAQYASEHGADISGLVSNISRAQRLQAGKEAELSELVVDSIGQLFGTLLDDVTLDFKIGEEAKEMLSETPDDSEEVELEAKIENIEDENILKEIDRRKILRTLAQGKGLTVKDVLNLPLFKNGLEDILGADAAEYLTLCNKISAACKHYDWQLSEEIIKGALRGGAAGACKITFEEKEKMKSDDEEKREEDTNEMIDDLEEGKDITDSDAAEEVYAGINAKITARGKDLSVLTHEAIKAIYLLPLQRSLEHMYGIGAEDVISNTDTLLDEAQEFKYGTEMVKDFEDAIFSYPKLKKQLDELAKATDLDFSSRDEESIRAEKERSDSAWNSIGALKERIFWLVYGKLGTIHQDDADKMLDIVYVILLGSKKGIEEMLHPLVESALEDLEAEAEYQAAEARYQAWLAAGGSEEDEDESDYHLPVTPQSAEPSSEEDNDEAVLAGLEGASQDAINNAIIDAYQSNNSELADKIRRRYIGESLSMPIEVWTRLYEVQKLFN